MQPQADTAALALDLLPWGVVLADHTGEPVAANNAARVLLGLNGCAGVSVSCEGQQVGLKDLLRDHVQGHAVRRRVALKHPEHGWLDATLTRVERRGGPPRVHVVVERGGGQDWRMAGRSDPLSVFAHELRNALTSLREGLALVVDGAAGELSDLQRRLLTGVREDADRMARLSDDMVAANRLHAGRVRVTARDVEAAALAQAVVHSFRSAAAEAEVDLDTGAMDAAARCHADPDLLTQALSNLVSNAVKFTPAGGRVRVGVRRLTDETGEECVALWVRDTGPGLPREALERLTSGGEAEGGATTDAQRGLGIGLSIAREIAEQHGGHLAVEGEPGRGSCFQVVVPTDFRRSERWLLALVADATKLARAVGAALSVVELRLRTADGAEGLWASERGLVQLPLIEQCVEESLRPSDTVVMHESSATLILHNVDGAAARRVAERTLAKLRKLFAMLPPPYPECALAFGAGSYPADGHTAAEVVRAARRELRAGGLAEPGRDSCEPGADGGMDPDGPPAARDETHGG